MLITEIAREACVSPATVSRAINQPQIVSPERLARIRAVMKQFNYVPLPVERRRGPKARLGTPRRIGVWFVGSKANHASLSWFSEQLLKIQSRDARYRMDLRIMTSSATELPRTLLTEKLDGVIVQGMEPSAECFEQLNGKPLVWFMTRRSSAFPGDYIEPNNEENGRIAADYLKSCGHKSVAVVSTDPDYSAIAQRTAAFIAHAKNAGLTVQSILGESHRANYLEIAPRTHEIASLATRLLACTPKATGIYLPSDHFCGAFFSTLREAGKKPGRDFDAILGNHNPAIYQNLDHAPATIDINLPMLVRKVVDHLLWRIEKADTCGRVGVSISPRLLTPLVTP
ncbi:LacI family DNA-binding transcriptional regulator [Oleiharenicola lentus]|uniref:LacI family DNA-binding transcriptional regulator n=1 Tax=Oleiharenicola lentus TaxID=2508720 RepID=UPI003F67E2EB